MRTAAVISEFNPFHNGHAHIMEMARGLGVEAVISLMSGDFVQRGEPAICDRFTRAKMALLSGADLVISYPARYSTASAEKYAEMAVRILNGLHCVDYLVFGSECGDIEPLLRCAEILANEPETYRNALRKNLKEGMSFPRARAAALPEFSQLLREPNNILGVEYCKALVKLGSSIEPVTFPRIGAGHNSDFHNQFIEEGSPVTAGNILSAAEGSLVTAEKLSAGNPLKIPANAGIDEAPEIEVSDVRQSEGYFTSHLFASGGALRGMILGDVRHTPDLIISQLNHLKLGLPDSDDSGMNPSDLSISQLDNSKMDLPDSDDSSMKDPDLRITELNTSRIKASDLASSHLSSYIPPLAYEVLEHYLSVNRPLTMEDFFPLLIEKLWYSDDVEFLTRFADVTPDLAGSLLRERGRAGDMSSLIGLMSSKSLTETHVRRALLHIALGIEDSGDKNKLLTQVLGFRISAQGLVSRIRKHAEIPVIINPAADERELPPSARQLFEEEKRLANLYEALLAAKSGREAVHFFRRPLIKR